MKEDLISQLSLYSQVPNIDVNHLVYLYMVHGQLHPSNLAAQLPICLAILRIYSSRERTAYQYRGVLGSRERGLYMQAKRGQVGAFD